MVFGGWNLDDFKIFTVEGDDADPPGDCVNPDNYGNGTPGTDGIVPTITSANGWPYIGNSNWVLRAEDFLGGASGTLLVGLRAESDSSQGWERLVGFGNFLVTVVGIDGWDWPDGHKKTSYSDPKADSHWRTDSGSTPRTPSLGRGL